MNDLYFIQASIVSNGRRIPYFPERDPDRMGYQNTRQDIESGEIDHVQHIYRWDIEGGTMRDVSEDMARDILDTLVDDPPRFLQEFLEDQLGCLAVAEHFRDLTM